MEAGRDGGREGWRQGGNEGDAGRDGGREAMRGRQGGMEAGRDGGREAMRGRQGGMEAGRDGGREGWRQGGNEGDAGRDGGREAMRGTQGGVEAGRDGGREGWRQGGNEGEAGGRFNIFIKFEKHFSFFLFQGQFCEQCAPGYTRQTPGGGPYTVCVPCNCYGHEVGGIPCHPETGVCNCGDNTAGRTCEICQNGYYGDATRGTPGMEMKPFLTKKSLKTLQKCTSICS